MKKAATFIISFLFFVPHQEAVAAGPTSVKDPIAVSTTWTKDNGPYIIQNDIVISKGAILTIEAGTSVQFTPPAEGKAGAGPNLVVQGGLKAIGTLSAPISFGSTVTGKPWGAIYFYGSDTVNSVLQACFVKGGRVVCNNASPTITQCAIYGSKSGVEIALNSQPQISGNRITANGIGIVLLADTASPVISNNDIYNNNYGFYLKDFGTPSVSGNRIYNNLKYNLVNYSSKPLNLPNNDFHQTDPALISRTIYDGGANAQLGRINFSPYTGMTAGQVVPATQASNAPQSQTVTQEKPEIQENDFWSYGRPFDAMKVSKIEQQKKESSGLVKVLAVGATAVVTVVLLFL